MTHVVSIRLRGDQVDRLKRFARRLGKSQSEMGAQFIEEAMREAEFANIEFRDSVLGRLAYMKDSNLAVWEVIMIARDHEMDAERIAAYFRRPRGWVNAAMHYYEAFRDEIDPVLEDNRSMTFEKLKRLLPTLETLPGSEGAAETAG
jgi:predicted transcriptional regulator